MDNRINEFKKLYDLIPFWIIFLILSGIMLNLIPYFYEGYDEFRYFFLFALILNISACILLIHLYLNRDKKLQEFKKGLERLKNDPEQEKKIKSNILITTYIGFAIGVSIIIIGVVLHLIRAINSDIMELFILIGISSCGGGLYIYYAGHKHLSKMKYQRGSN